MSEDLDVQAAYESAGQGAAIGATIGSFVYPGIGTAVGTAVGAIVGAAVELGDWLSGLFESTPRFEWVNDRWGRRYMPRGWTPDRRFGWEHGAKGDAWFAYRRAIEDGASRSEALEFLARAIPHTRAQMLERAAAQEAREQRALTLQGFHAREQYDQIRRAGSKAPAALRQLIAATTIGWLRSQGVDAATAADFVRSRLGAEVKPGTAEGLEHARSVYLRQGEHSVPLRVRIPDDGEDDGEHSVPLRVRIPEDGEHRVPVLRVSPKRREEAPAPAPRPIPWRPSPRPIPHPVQAAPPPAPEVDAMQEITIPIGPYRVSIRIAGDRVAAWADVATPWGPVRVAAMASIDTVRGAFGAMNARGVLDAIAGDDEIGAAVRMNAAVGRVAEAAARAAGAKNPRQAASAARVAHAMRVPVLRPKVRRVVARARAGDGEATRALKVAQRANVQRVSPADYSAMVQRYDVRPYWPGPSYRPGWV